MTEATGRQRSRPPLLARPYRTDVDQLTRRSALLIALGGAGAALTGCGSGGRPRPSATAAAASAALPPTAPSAQPSAGGPAVEVTHGPRNRQQVALTFHGAGPIELTDRLLSEAERAGAAVTVFAIGSWLAATPAAAPRILQGGHQLANHTYTHPDLARYTASQVSSEITRTRDLLEQVEGSNGTYFRPSAMDHATPLVLERAGAAGYPTVVSFDADPADYTDPGAGAVRDRTLAMVQPGSIVSLHLGHPGTVTALPEILTGLAHRGLKAVTVRTLLSAR